MSRIGGRPTPLHSPSFFFASPAYLADHSPFFCRRVDCVSPGAGTNRVGSLIPPPPSCSTALTYPFADAAQSLARQLLNSRTHNRRRWTHVFPPGETEFHTMDTMPGPIWNSLCQPALLPLSIDFVPSPHVRLPFAGERVRSMCVLPVDEILFFWFCFSCS